MTQKSEPPEKKNIVLLHHPLDIDEYLKIQEKLQGTHLLIAATPDVCWELERRQIPFVGIDKYYDSGLFFLKGLKNFKYVEYLCHDLDIFFQNDFPLLRNYNFRPAMDNFYSLKILYDSLILRIQIIQSIVNSERPDVIVIFESIISKQKSEKKFPSDTNENLFNSILNLGIGNFQIVVLTRTNFDQKETPPNLIKKFYHIFLKAIKHMPFIYMPMYAVKNFGFVSAISLSIHQIINLGHKKTLFLIRPDPSWGSMITKLYEKGYNIRMLYEPDQTRIRDIGKDQHSSQILEIFKQYCITDSVDFSKIIHDRFFPVLTAYISCVPDVIKNVEHQITTEHPKAFLCSEKSTALEHMYAHLAHFHNIPVITWQHGDGPFYPPMQVYVEIMDSDIHMSYGSGHTKMLKSAPHNKTDCKIESVGSLALEKKFFEKADSHLTKKILYVTTGYYYNDLYVNAYPYHDNVLWEYQKKILEVLGRAEIPTIFKINPNDYGTPFIYDYIKKRQFSNIKIIRNERTFNELLAEAELVICDFASTPVIESIAAHKTVFVLLNTPDLREEAISLLKKRVYWSSDIDGLTQIISDYIQGKTLDQHPDLNNTEYLETFGVYKLDGNVAKRVIDIIDREGYRAP